MGKIRKIMRYSFLCLMESDNIIGILTHLGVNCLIFVFSTLVWT